MLNRKLRNTGLAGNGLLFIIAVLSVAATRHTFYAGQQSASDSAIQQLHFDTTLLLLTGNVETAEFNVPTIGMNKKAVTFVNDYIAKNSRSLEEIRKRSADCFATMDAVFTKYGLPLQLKYAAVVESQLKSRAVSRVGAVGTWQFMPVTARYFSLKITAKYDERKHLYKSTVAAARYFKDLHKLFGDWLLVIAAYNSGPGKVYDAIKKSGSRNFWKLQDYLPAETRGHVKKFISTHYFFEGQGSVTTLTKAEVAAFRKTMTAFVEQQNTMLKEKQMAILAGNVGEISGEEEMAKTVIKSESKFIKENEK